VAKMLEVYKFGEYVFTHVTGNPEEVFEDNECRICGKSVRASDRSEHAQNHICLETTSRFSNGHIYRLCNQELKEQLNKLSSPLKFLKFFCKAYEDFLEETKKDYVKKWKNEGEKGEIPEPCHTKWLYAIFLRDVANNVSSNLGEFLWKQIAIPILSKHPSKKTTLMYCPYCDYLWRMKRPHSYENPPSKCPRCHKEIHSKIRWILRYVDFRI